MDAPSLEVRLRQVQSRLAKRDAWLRTTYGVLLILAVVFFVLVPTPLSRIGSIILVIGFGYMIWRCTSGNKFNGDMRHHLNNQIALAQSVLFNVPFLVGTNLFWMGLPGPGTVLFKAGLDLIFLVGTTLLLTTCYIFNQRFIRRELIPLRDQLPCNSER